MIKYIDLTTYIGLTVLPKRTPAAGTYIGGVPPPPLRGRFYRPLWYGPLLGVGVGSTSPYTISVSCALPITFGKYVYRFYLIP